MKLINKFQQTILSDILKTKGKLKIMRNNNVHDNSMHMTSGIM